MEPERFFVDVEGYPKAEILVVKSNKSISFFLFLNGCGPQLQDCLLKIESLGGVIKCISSNAVFSASDYFQHTFNSEHKGLQLGHKIHDFIIKNKRFEFPTITNIYSTNNALDSNRNPNLKISKDAIKFWKNRVSLGKAEFVNSLGRYKILW